MPGNGHVRFGGRIEETDRWKHRHRASVRPYNTGAQALYRAAGGQRSVHEDAAFWWQLQ